MSCGGEGSGQNSGNGGQGPPLKLPTSDTGLRGPQVFPVPGLPPTSLGLNPYAAAGLLPGRHLLPTASLQPPTSSGVIRPPTRPLPPGDLLSSGGSGSGQGMSNKPLQCNTDPSMDNTPAGQRLKVEDALSYLDQVKMQFQSRPQVYSDFLDIMKDFKSQSIDTPGVIQRVSSLFRGHPTLIVGFNTFLPPGYKIEVDGEHGERVSICTPTGTSLIITEERGGVGAAVTGGPGAGGGEGAGGQGTRNTGATGGPIEFNHAITYVNKIKGRFQHKPEVYKQFLEILHNYQKEQRDLKAGCLELGHKPLTETQVYSSVAKLFSDEPDLLREFSQFLPDAMGMGSGMMQSFQNTTSASLLGAPLLPQPVPPQPSSAPDPPPQPTSVSPRAPPQPEASDNTAPSATPVTAPDSANSVTPSTRRPIKREASPGPPPKRQKFPDMSHGVSFSEASRYGTLNEFQFFDKVRKAFKNEAVYTNFLRILSLFNVEMISKSELLELVHPFLGKFPELIKWLTDFLGCSERVPYSEAIPQKALGNEERISSDLALEIDYASCKRYGVSYRALPDSYQQPQCSGRTKLCKEVLNDTWVSFPSWSSEDTSYVSSKKSQYEEFIYRTEDERFELDIVIEVNRTAIYSLEAVNRRMQRMSGDELKKFRLDESLGSRSPPLMERAVRRIYGEKAPEIMEGMQKNPGVAVPLVLKRLKTKQEEWREAQKGFNRIWRDQNEKYFLKALDHQGLSFKQNDLKQMRSKYLLNQIEIIYDERHEKMEQGGMCPTGPHMEIQYAWRTKREIFYDVVDLLIHHVKRHTGISGTEKLRIKKLLNHTLPDLFGLNRSEMSDDEDDNSEEREEESGEEARGRSLRSSRSQAEFQPAQPIAPAKSNTLQVPKLACAYALIFTPSCWYVFLRLHQICFERMAKLSAHADAAAAEGEFDSDNSVAAALQCERKAPCPPQSWYSAMVNHVKNVLDGQIDSSQYEDQLREMFTTQAYTAFTMDKLISAMVKQLQVMVTDESSIELSSLFEKYRSLGGAGGSLISGKINAEKEASYQSKAEQYMTDQNCFKTYFFHEDGRVTFELLDTDATEEEEGKGEAWAEYLQDYLLPPSLSPTTFASRMGRRPVFMLRNLGPRKWRKNRNGKGSGGRKRGRGEGEEASASPDTDSPSNPSPTEGCILREDLEYAVGGKGLKFRYIAGTADCLYRPGTIAKARKGHKSRFLDRRQRFDAWREKRCGDKDGESGTEKWFLESEGVGSELWEDVVELLPGIYINKYSTLPSRTPSTQPAS